MTRKRFVKYTIEVAREIKYTSIEGLEIDQEDSELSRPVQWTVKRRYSEFVVLHKYLSALIKKTKNDSIPEFPYTGINIFSISPDDRKILLHD